MVLWVIFGGFSVVTILWILWSAFDKAVAPQLVYNRSLLNCSVLKHCPVLQSPYVPTWFWGKSGHIQTVIYGKMGRIDSPMPRGSRCAKLLADGATMTYDVFEPLGSLKTGDVGATLLVCPGIANSSESIYIRTFVYHAQQNGLRVAVLNHLGALDDVPLTSPRIYTYGGTDEYGLMVEEMMGKYPDNKFIAVGFSMGANIVVKYLGEHEHVQSQFVGAISCCQGYDLIECTPFLLSCRGGRYFYIRAMTEHQKRILRRHQKVLFGNESLRSFGSFDVDKIFGAATLLDLDIHYSHKRAGFKSCEEYYHWCSSRHYIHQVNMPMLLLNAVDDPIVPPELHYIPRQFALKRDNVIFAMTHHGGHLGYFEGGVMLPNAVTWLDRIVVEYSLALLSCQSSATLLQQHQLCTANGSYANCEPSTKIPTSANGDDDDTGNDAVELQKQDTPTSPEADHGENELAAEMVTDILRVSASVVYCNNTTSVLPHAPPSLSDDDDVIAVKSTDINHSVMYEFG